MATNEYIPMYIKLAKSNVYQVNSQEKVYEDWKVISGQIQLSSGLFVTQPYGTMPSFDLVLILDSNSTTRKIDYSTHFLINEMPTKNFEYGNYEVSKIFPPQNGKIRIGLNSINGTRLVNLYYLDNNVIYAFEINYDYDTKIGYVSVDKDIPFNTNSTIWEIFEPISTNDNNNRIKLSSKTKIGVTKEDKRFYKLTFVSVNG